MARDIIDDRLIGSLHVRALTRAGLEHDPVTEHTAFQSGTLDALMAGRYDGDTTVGELLAHGNHGLGTVQRLGGELIVLDGEAWVVDGDGAVHRVADDTTTPFAVVCRFAPVATVDLTGPLGLAGLHDALDALAPTRDAVLAVRVTGRFADLRLRSVHAQTRPYPPLVEVTEHQTEWEIDAAVGSVVGFRFPTAAAGLDVPGHHLHFLGDDRATGGHVLDLTLIGGTAAVDDVGDLHVELPTGVDLGRPTTRSDLDAIRTAEGGA